METYETVFRKILLAACAWLLLSGLVFGLARHGEHAIAQHISDYVEHWRGKKPYQGPDIDAAIKKLGTEVVPYLQSYVDDPCEDVRWQAYRLMTGIARGANSIPERRRICDDLVKGLTLGRCAHIAIWLLKFNFTSADFSQEARALLTQELSQVLANEKMGPRKEIILLSGRAKLESELPSLQQFIEMQEGILTERQKEHVREWQEAIEALPNMPGYPPRKRFEKQLKKQYWQSSEMWAALRARAAMGVKEDIARCIELVESHPDEDYRVVRLLKELSYVRQPEVVDYLHTYLKSDKLEGYAGRDVIQLTYGQRAAIALGEMLRGFSWKKDYAPNHEMVDHCREWMAQQNEWDIVR